MRGCTSVHSEGSRRNKSEVEPFCPSGLQVLACSGQANEMCVSVHLCETYLMNNGAFEQRESNQTLVVNGAAARPSIYALSGSKATSSPES